MENVSGLVKGEKFFSNKIVSDHVTLSIKGDRIYHMSVNKLLQTLHITDYKWKCNAAYTCSGSYLSSRGKH